MIYKFAIDLNTVRFSSFFKVQKPDHAYYTRRNYYYYYTGERFAHSHFDTYLHCISNLLYRFFNETDHSFVNKIATNRHFYTKMCKLSSIQMSALAAPCSPLRSTVLHLKKVANVIFQRIIFFSFHKS